MYLICSRDRYMKMKLCSILLIIMLLIPTIVFFPSGQADIAYHTDQPPSWHQRFITKIPYTIQFIEEVAVLGGTMKERTVIMT